MMLTELKQKAHISFTLNGEAAEVAFAPHKTLLEVLREDLNLTGTKHGCELGECGTCAVLVDGRAILSCLMLGLDAEGRDVNRGSRRGAMWLLLARISAHSRRTLEEESESNSRRDKRSTIRKHLPLHWLHQDL
jgi:hypothetical protein